MIQLRVDERVVDETTEAGSSSRPHQPGHATFRWRLLLLVGVAISIVLIGYYVISLFQVYSAGRTDESQSVDAIVVMGAAQYDGRPSPQLAARLDHVVELWPEGLAPVVVVTSAIDDSVPGVYSDGVSSSGLIERRVDSVDHLSMIRVDGEAWQVVTAAIDEFLNAGE